MRAQDVGEVDAVGQRPIARGIQGISPQGVWPGDQVHARRPVARAGGHRPVIGIQLIPNGRHLVIVQRLPGYVEHRVAPPLTRQRRSDGQRWLLHIHEIGAQGQIRHHHETDHRLVRHHHVRAVGPVGEHKAQPRRGRHAVTASNLQPFAVVVGRDGSLAVPGHGHQIGHHPEISRPVGRGEQPLPIFGIHVKPVRARLQREVRFPVRRPQRGPPIATVEPGRDFLHPTIVGHLAADGGLFVREAHARQRRRERQHRLLSVGKCHLQHQVGLHR